MEPLLQARIPSTKPAKRKALNRPLVVSLVKRKRGGLVHLGVNLPHWVCEYIISIIQINNLFYCSEIIIGHEEDSLNNYDF